MKKLTILFISFFIVYIIYQLANVNNINYVSIDDGILSSYSYNIKNYLNNKNRLGSFNNYFTSSSIIDTYNDIKNNRTILVDKNLYYLKKVLRESDVLVISLGMVELASNFNKYDMDSNYSCFNEMILNIEKLIYEIKKYAYSKIIFLGYYNPTNYYDANIDRFFYDINIKLERLMINNEVIYIDLYELIKNNNYKDKHTIYLNYDGIKKISSIIKYYLK